MIKENAGNKLSNEFDLVQSLPPRAVLEDLAQTVEDAKIAGSVVLALKK